MHVVFPNAIWYEVHKTLEDRMVHVIVYTVITLPCSLVSVLLLSLTKSEYFEMSVNDVMLTVTVQEISASSTSYSTHLLQNTLKYSTAERKTLAKYSSVYMAISQYTWLSSRFEPRSSLAQVESHSVTYFSWVN